MLRRLVTLWLMLSMLGFGSAWAIDLHLDGDGHHVASSETDHHPDDVVDCDHCCHLGLHLLGMVSSYAVPDVGRQHLSLRFPENALASRNGAPPLKPPRS